jgi:hypothetical protein
MVPYRARRSPERAWRRAASPLVEGLADRVAQRGEDVGRLDKEFLAPLQAAFRHGDDSREVPEIRTRHWTVLCRFAFPWRDEEGYDTRRWRRPDFHDATHESEMVAYHRRTLR